MKKQLFLILSFVLITGLFSSCTVKQGIQSNDTQFTLGLVQKEIYEGMSQTEVIEALGSPNQVTKDNNDNQTWVYDKISTEARYDRRDSGVFLILGGISNRSESVKVSQKTLTVIIKFDANSRVDTFSYHSSSY